ncbi:MAG TPA: DUF952 domain-containing protein [Dehalococcoidia bacterium]|nr:DUF952 domain-containing protein [Dehalococcoidia bacterium]
MPSGEIIYHVMRRSDWDDYFFERCYEPPSLHDEGFIRASTFDQVLETAEHNYPGRGDLVLLLIDPSWLGCDVRYEDQSGNGVVSPNIYGHVSYNAILCAYDLPLSAAGRFELPRALVK